MNSACSAGFVCGQLVADPREIVHRRREGAQAVADQAARQQGLRAGFRFGAALDDPPVLLDRAFSAPRSS
jgi:hypothetical protein